MMLSYLGVLPTATSAFKKHEESSFHKQVIPLTLLPQQCGDIGEIIDNQVSREKESNREVFLVILRAIQFLARQGLALKGHEQSKGNLFQLLKMISGTNVQLATWLQRKQDKFLAPECQNILQLMAHAILCKILAAINESKYYTIMADEVTDSSNREQFVLCFRSVSNSFEVSEDLIGLYNVDDITSATLVSTIKDVLLCFTLSISNCRGQCYDGASNMAGIKSGVATVLQKEEPRAILTHCYGHSLQLAVSDTVKQVKLMQDTLDVTLEISKLLKYSPKRHTLFNKLKDELAPEKPGFRVLCPTRWTVRASSLQSVLDNWQPLQDLWDECLQTKLESEVKSRIIGVKYQMEKFEYFFGVSLASLIFGHSDNLSKTLQHTYISAVEGQSVSKMSVKTLEVMRSDTQFDLFWSKVFREASHLDVDDPTIPRKRKRPTRFESGNATQSFPESPKDYFRHIYISSLDSVITCIKS